MLVRRVTHQAVSTHLVGYGAAKGELTEGDGLSAPTLRLYTISQAISSLAA